MRCWSLGGAFGAAFSASPRLSRRGSAAKLFNLFLFALWANSKAIILIPEKDFPKSDLEKFFISAIIKNGISRKQDTPFNTI